MLASLCAAACIGVVVWSIYAAFGQQIFDLRQAVLQPVRAWAVAPRAPSRRVTSRRVAAWCLSAGAGTLFGAVA